MCPSRRRPPRLYNPNADYRSDVTIYRCGVKFCIPAMHTTKNGLIKKNIAKLIRNATKENIMQLEELGVSCLVDDMPLYGFDNRVAN